MKSYAAAEIRNFALVGHGGAGKTMLSEAMLACSGVINRMGHIDSNSTVSDYHQGEHQRQISIHSSLMHTEWLGKKLNIIDTPGYQDFVSEAISALRVADFALLVIHAQQGVAAGTEQTWQYAAREGIPRVLVVNALDKEETHFDQVLAEARQRFGNRVFPLSLPINAGPGFNQVLDVLRSEIITYQTDGSGRLEEAPATGVWQEQVNQLHRQLIEYIAESDDTLLDKFFAQDGLSEDELRGGVHAAVQKQSFVPLFAVSAETNVGVARLMDFISKYGSSPVDRPKVEATDANENVVEVRLEDPDPVLHVFKTMSEAHVGELSFFRVYSGHVSMGNDLYNPDRNVVERIGQIFLLNGRQRVSVSDLKAGDIGAVVKLKDTHTGNTLCKSGRSAKLAAVELPKPNIRAALQVQAKGDEDKIAKGLAALHEEDPSFHYYVDGELHQTVLSGQGDLHLQVIADRLKERFNVGVELIEPRIPFRETIRANADSKYRHKKQSGGAGQFAEVWLRIQPGERGSGVEFKQSLTGQNVDRVFVPSVEKGINAACQEGIMAGYKVVDLKVDFYDGKMHPVDSKDIAFQIAGKEAFREAFMKAQPCMLEPIYDVEVRIPEESLGRVVGDLSSRRGKIGGMELIEGVQVVKAQVPAAELHQYSTHLRSLTGGRGVHTESFSHYEQVPAEVEKKLTAQRKNHKEKEHA